MMPAELARSDKAPRAAGFRIGGRALRRYDRDGIGHDMLDGIALSAMRFTNEVLAVLEQPAHEVGQQVLVAAHRRVDPQAWPCATTCPYRFAHPMQALELECPAPRAEDAR
jgi:hypothetical protein